MQSNQSILLANLRMLEFAATKLGEICNEVVFLGGCTTGHFVQYGNLADDRIELLEQKIRSIIRE